MGDLSSCKYCLFHPRYFKNGPLESRLIKLISVCGDLRKLVIISKNMVYKKFLSPFFIFTNV